MATTSHRSPAEIPFWYHTFDLPGGRPTAGIFDHRKVVEKLPIPADLSGLRCLDLASADGFFAIEMAKRGGDVVSVDLEDPAGRDWQGDAPEPGGEGTGCLERFEAMRSLLGLEIDRRNMNLYDVSPETLGGTFDFVFMGNVLLHLSDPARILRNVRSVTGGRFLSFETISLTLTLTRPFTASAALGIEHESRWWTPNLRGHRRLLEATGFEIVGSRFPIFQPFGSGIGRRPRRMPWKTPTPLKNLTYWTAVRTIGVASAATLCEVKSPA